MSPTMAATFADKMNEKNIAAAFATSLSISLFIAAFVDPCILRFLFN